MTVKPNIDCVQTSGLEVGQLPGQSESIGGDGQGLHAGDGLQPPHNVHHVPSHQRLSPRQSDLRFLEENVKYGEIKLFKILTFLTPSATKIWAILMISSEERSWALGVSETPSGGMQY